MDTYRGYEIKQEGELFVWIDDRGFVHNGRVDTKGGFKTQEAAMDDIDGFKRRYRETAR